MPPRATTDALLRLRQADEREAMRTLQRAREAAERATAVRDRAAASRAELAAKLVQQSARGGPFTAGALVTRDAYRDQLRARRATADQTLRASEASLRAALDELTEAQKRMEQALRAREAAERQRASEDKALARRRERRDQAATDDRWRPPRR